MRTLDRPLMRRRAAGVAAAALTGSVLALAATPALADGALRITQVDSQDGAVNVVVSATSGAIDPSSVQLSIDGTTVASTAETAGDSGVSRTTVLAIDVSGSMQGDGIAGATAAATEYLQTVPDDVAVGLVSFADTARVVTPPTTDRAAVRLALNGLLVGGETALYDGVSTAVTAAGSEGIRSVLLLSDGGDTASKTTLADVTTKAAESGAVVDAVAFQTEESVGQTLTGIADATNGRVITVTAPGDVSTAFAASAQETANQVVVTADVPTQFSGASATVTVAADVAGSTDSDSAVVTLGTAAPQGATSAVAQTGLFGSTWALALALLAIFAGIAAVIWYSTKAVAARRTTGSTVQRELKSYRVGNGTAAPVETKTETRTALGNSQVATSAVDFAGRVIKKRNLEGELERKLQAGAIALRPGEWFLIHTVATVAGGLLMFALTTRLLPLLIGLVIGFLLPLAYLSRKERKRRDQFIEQLPDTLTLLASSLSAGHSFPQAVDAVVRNGQKPVADEFGRALNQSRVGVPIEDTLEEVAERMKCEDLSWVVMAVRVNREVGGNLSEVLNNVANTLRERMYLKRQVKALSADGRLSTYVLTALPIVLALFLLVRNPTYIEPLFGTVVGLLMLAAGTVLLVLGWIWMKTLSKVEV